MKHTKVTLRNILLSTLGVCVVLVVVGLCRCLKTTDNSKYSPATIHMGLKETPTSAYADSAVSLMIGNSDFCKVTEEDGLPNQDVRCILKDTVGYVWIGTSYGMARYDGAHLHAYPATANDNIWSMAELDADTMLVGTAMGIKLYSRRQDKWQSLVMPSTIVKAICKLHDGNVLIATEEGLFLWNRHHANSTESACLKRIRIESGLGKSNHITSLLSDGERGCWFATANGLGYYDVTSERVSMYRMPVNIDNSNFFNSLAKYGNDIFLGSFNKGIFSFNLKSHTFRKEAGFEHNMILKLKVFSHYLLVGTNGLGLKIKNLLTGDVNIVKHIARKPGALSSNTVQEIQVIGGKPWIGTQFGGLCYLPNSEKKYEVYSYNDFFSSDYSVRCFFEYTDGSKLIGTRDGLFYIDEHKHIVRHFTSGDGKSALRSNIVTYIGSVDGCVAVGTYGGGIHIFDRNTLALADFSQEEMALYGCVFDIRQTNDGNIWVATQEGLYLLSDERKVMRIFTPENSPLKSAAIYKLAKDAFGRLWVGTYAGLYIVDTNTYKILPCGAMPTTAKVNYLMPDLRQSMWVATNCGLYHIDADLRMVAKYDAQAGLPETDVVALMKDDGKQLWVATAHYIAKIDVKGNKLSSKSSMKLPKGATFNNASVVCDSSHLWWCNSRGLISMKRNNGILQSCDTFYPMVSAYSQDGITTPVVDEDINVDVKSSVRTLELSLTNLRYAYAYSNSYECKLEGYDKEWRLLDGENTIAYTDLPSGNYIFKIRDPKTKRGSQIAVHVQMNYKVVIAIVCGILILIGLMWYSYRKITSLRIRLKKEREVLGDAINSKKQTMQTRKSNAENMDQLEERLLDYMQKEKPYLNARLTIGELAVALATSETDLSLLLNNKMNINWSNFVNAYRVDEMKRRLQNDGLSKYTLTALAEQCGFVSKTTFHRVFKQNTGMTPAEYCKQNNILASKR